MEYKQQESSIPRIRPRLIIHGGAGNIQPANLTPDRYRAHREALLTIVSRTYTYMQSPSEPPTTSSPFPTALDVATFAVSQLENDPLFNAGHGAVFTRDGINELEASVMVSRGHAKRGVGVTGLRRVRNPILLAKALLEHGDADLAPKGIKSNGVNNMLDVPSAQGHTLLHGPTAEQLAAQYGLELVGPDYFFTQRRWDEHVRALEREKSGQGFGTWSAEEYLPQGTVGAIALDTDGVVCAATSTGGLTNKLTGRIGDTPSVGAGFWAEEWTEEGDPTAAWKGCGGRVDAWKRAQRDLRTRPGPAVILSDALKGMLADCLPTPLMYSPVQSTASAELTTTRSVAVSGTGNGDSFLRVAAARSVGSIARFGVVPSAVALTKVSGPAGELQLSAGDRFGKTGEGEGGIIGIESVVVRGSDGKLVAARSEIIQDYNCGGMFRAWIDDAGQIVVRVWREQDDTDLPPAFVGEGRPENVRDWCGEKCG